MTELQCPWGEGDAVLAGFGQLSDPMIVTRKEDDDLIVRAANDSARALFPGRELVGVPLREAFADLVDQQILDQYEECYRRGEPLTFKEWRLQLAGPDGSPTVIYADYEVTPWRDSDGRVVGVLGRAVTITEQVKARQAAEQRGQEAQRRFLAAQELVTTLQDALLPEQLPVVPGLDVAARYLLAIEDTAAGGDWFDAVVRPGGQVALVVGDVVGHGVAASAVMGQLRAVLHERLLSGSSLSDALRDLDRYASVKPGSHAATVCVAEVDPQSGAMEYCTVGHPPPLIVANDGATRFVEPTGSGPLATGSEMSCGHEQIGADELVLLYTDGVIERPGRSATESTGELARVASDTALKEALSHGAPSRTVERVCQLGLELLTRVTGYSDDITMLAAQRVPRITPLERTWPATPESIAQARSDLRAWLDAVDVRDLDAMAVQHAIGELVSNVVEHAYDAAAPAGSRDFDLVVSLEPTGVMHAEVTDRGRWKQPLEAGHRGNGLAMASGFVDELVLEPGDLGTTARVAYRLSRPAMILSGAASGTRQHSLVPGADVGFEAHLLPGELRARIHGPVHEQTLDTFRSRLNHGSRGGTQRLVVDLAEVSHLGSAGVQVLLELVARDDSPVTLYAPAGSVAQHVLALVNLPHVTTDPDADVEDLPPGL